MWAQDCYIRLSDPSGLNTDSCQVRLNTAACQLVESFPAAFQDSFKVYDFGFYLHNEVMEGGYPALFTEKVAEIAGMSAYYLIFGKQTDSEGVYTRIWVDLKLPETGSFECMEEVERDIIKGQVSRKTKMVYAANNNLYQYYGEAEIACMNLLKRYVTKIKDCCYTELKSESCSPCVDVETMRGFMEDNGFVSFPVDILTHAPMSSTGVVDEFAQLSFTVDTFSLDINADIIPFFTKAAEKIPNIKANIYFYEEFGAHCLDIQNLVGGQGNVAAVRRGSDEAKDGFAEEDYLFQLDVIGSVGEDGSKMVHVRFEGAELKSPWLETGTINLVFLDDPQVPVNETMVKNYLVEFYDIIDVPVNIEIAPPSPVTFNITELDGVVFIGPPSEILKYALFTVDGFNQYYVRDEGDYIQFRNLNSNNPEIACRLYRLSFVRSRNSGSFHRSSILLANKSVVEKYQCDNFEHLLGFLCFHSMGHFSYLHDHPYIEQFGPYKTDLGFMDHGQNIIRMLQLNFDKNLNLEINADLEEGESASIRDLVRFTEVNYEQVISTFWYLFNRISIGN